MGCQKASVGRFAAVRLKLEANVSVPYIVGNPIKKSSDFYGVHELLARLSDIIDGKQAQSVSLLGLKRSGKTSLLYYLDHPSDLAQYVANPDAYVTLYVDFSVCDTPSEFFRQVYQGLLHKLVSMPMPKYCSGRFTSMMATG